MLAGLGAIMPMIMQVASADPAAAAAAAGLRGAQGAQGGQCGQNDPAQMFQQILQQVTEGGG